MKEQYMEAYNWLESNYEVLNDTEKTYHLFLYCILEAMNNPEYETKKEKLIYEQINSNAKLWTTTQEHRYTKANDWLRMYIGV